MQGHLTKKKKEEEEEKRKKEKTLHLFSKIIVHKYKINERSSEMCGHYYFYNGKMELLYGVGSPFTFMQRTFLDTKSFILICI